MMRAGGSGNWDPGSCGIVTLQMASNTVKARGYVEVHYAKSVFQSSDYMMLNLHTSCKVNCA